jgi:hypothetical protein
MPGRQRGNGTVSRASRAPRGDEGTRDKVEDLFQLIVAYAKQETLDPVVKQLKTLLKGIGGALLVALGTVLLSIGLLRALQTEFGGARNGGTPMAVVVAPKTGRVLAVVGGAFGTGAHLSGDWSWVPYLVGALFALLVAGFCVLRFLKGGPAR